MAGRANARRLVSSRSTSPYSPLPSHFSPSPPLPIEFHRIEIKIISLDRGQSDNDFDVNARDSIRAVGAFALHINMINAANIVARRISHGHVTVCTAISEGQERGERERERYVYANQVVFFVFLFSLFF